MIRNSKKRRAFYVVQFIELPFEGIDDYVCVPDSWLVKRRATDQKVVVAYPNNEDPFNTRDRAKRKERYGDEWKFYMAVVKHESDCYNDSEFWIATRNDYGPLVQEKSKITDTQPRFTLNKKLRSANQSQSSKFNKPKKQLDKEPLKLDKAAQSSSDVVMDANAKPGCSKRKLSHNVQDNRSMKCARTEETAAASNGDESTQTQGTERNEQALSLPVIEVDEPTEVINIDEDHSQRFKKPDENNSINQRHLSCNTTAASTRAAIPSTSAEQTTQPNQHNNQEHILNSGSSVSNFQPRIENDHEQRVNDVSNNALSSPLRSLKISTQLYSQMKGARRLVPIEKPGEKYIRPMNIERKLAIPAQNPKTLMDEPGTSSMRSVEEQSSYSTESNDYVHRPNSRTIRKRIPSLRQNSTHRSNPMYQTSELPQERPPQPQQDSERQPHRPKIRIDVSIKPKNNRKMPTSQGVTKKTLSTILPKLLNSIKRALSTSDNNYILNEQKLQAGLSTGTQNIAASATRDNHNPEMNTCSFPTPSRIQHTTAHENMYQNLYTQREVVNQSTGSNSKAKRGHFMDDVARSTVNESHLNVRDNACQTDECMVEESLSTFNAVTSDYNAVTDHEVISDHEMSIGEVPAETTNNVYCTGIPSGSSFADRPTAAQNSTSITHQTHPRVVLEQQMLDNFASLFTQMGTTLRYTCDMYNNLRSSILETAEIYKKLLSAVERFNMEVNSATNASTSSNLTPEVPQATEDSHIEVTARASSSNGDQHINDVANKVPKKKHNNLWRFVLPPEYDPHDSRWTLKYREYLIGLVELMPQSGIYVSYGDLKYCQAVSKDCKSLARRLLTGVFNRKALSVCLSMSERAQASNNVGSNVRPELDDHACAVLLNFVLEHGLQCGWNTDLKPILSTLHGKTQEIRFKYGVLVQC